MSPSGLRVVLPVGGGGLLGCVHVAVLEGGDCTGGFWTGGVVVEPQWFCH